MRIRTKDLVPRALFMLAATIGFRLAIVGEHLNNEETRQPSHSLVLDTEQKSTDPQDLGTPTPAKPEQQSPTISADSKIGRESKSGSITLPTYANGGPAATATPAPAETAPPAESEPTVEPERISRDSEQGQKLIEVGREEVAKQLTQDALAILSTINMHEIIGKAFDNKSLVLTTLPRFDAAAWTAVEDALTEKVNAQLSARKLNVSQSTVRVTRGKGDFGDLTVAQWQVTVMIPTSAGDLFKLTDLQAKTDTKQEEIMGQHIEATGTAHVQWTYWGSSDDWKRLIPVGEITTKVELIGQSPDFNTLAVVQ